MSSEQKRVERWVKLQDLADGAIFETRGGIRAVKSEYTYPNGGIQCILLASGEYAHFCHGESAHGLSEAAVAFRHNETMVREISLYDPDPAAVQRVVDAAKAVDKHMRTTNVARSDAEWRVLNKLQEEIDTLSALDRPGEKVEESKAEPDMPPDGTRWEHITDGTMWISYQMVGGQLIGTGSGGVRYSPNSNGKTVGMHWQDLRSGPAWIEHPPTPTPAAPESAESVAERLRQWTDTGQSFFDHAEKLIRDRDAQWQAKMDELTRELADAKAGNDYEAWTKERDELRAKLAAAAKSEAGGIDKELLETARTILPTCLSHLHEYVDRGMTGLSEGWRDHVADEAVKIARALHAALRESEVKP